MSDLCTVAAKINQYHMDPKNIRRPEYLIISTDVWREIRFNMRREFMDLSIDESKPKCLMGLMVAEIVGDHGILEVR